MRSTNAIILIFLLLTFVSGCTSLHPKTQIVSEEPLIIGYITDINKEKQVIQVVENISREEALNGTVKDNGSWVQINGLNIDDTIEIGNKVAIWDSSDIENSSEAEKKVMPIAKSIVLIEK